MSKKNKTTKASNSIKPIFQDAEKQDITNNKNWFYGAIVFLIIITFIAFSGGFNNDFVEWDDEAYVTQNSLVKKPDGNWGKAWNTHVALNYHPLTMTSLMLNSNIFGIKSATSFIVTNVLIHLMNVLLVFWFILLLLKDKNQEYLPTSGKPFFVAFVSSVLFAIHPMRVESVIWVSERKDVLYSFFFLAGCITYLKYIDGGKVRKYLVYSFLLFLASCLSKGQAVVLPIVFLLLDYLRGRKFEGSVILEKIPFLALSILFGVIASNIQGGGNFYGLINGLDKNTFVAIYNKHNLLDGIKYASYGLSQYWIKFLFPYSLSSFYPVSIWGQGFINYNYTFGVIFSCLVLGITFLSFKKSNIIFFGICFFGITFILVSQILLVGGAVMADRYTYLPYIGLSIALFSLIASFSQKNKSSKYLTVGLISIFTIFFIVKTRSQVNVWENTRTLMTQRTELYPKDDRAHYLIAKYTGEKEDNYDLCIEEYLKCLQTADTTKVFDIWGNIAVAFDKKKDYSKAIEYYNIAVRKDPKNSFFLMNRGNAYLNLQQPDKALPDLEKALNMPQNSDKALTRGSLATAQLNVGKYREALDNYNIVIDKEGVNNNPEYFYNRGVAKTKFGDNAGAIEDIKICVKLKPDHQKGNEALRLFGIK